MKQAGLKVLDAVPGFGDDHRVDTAPETDPAGTDPAGKALLSRLRRLEAENRELRRANEILRRTALFFGSSEDRR